VAHFLFRQGITTFRGQPGKSSQVAKNDGAQSCSTVRESHFTVAVLFQNRALTRE
jgi:hypothetical protein